MTKPQTTTEEESMDQGMYFGGVPTEPDVNKIRASYPSAELATGQIIPYTKVATIIGEPAHSNRFRTVTDRWRRLVENETRNLVIGTEPGKGFKVLDEKDKIGLSSQKLRTAARSARRSYKITGRVAVSQLSDQDKGRLLQLQQRSAALIASAQIKQTAELPTLEGK